MIWITTWKGSRPLMISGPYAYLSAALDFIQSSGCIGYTVTFTGKSPIVTVDETALSKKHLAKADKLRAAETSTPGAPPCAPSTPSVPSHTRAAAFSRFS